MRRMNTGSSCVSNLLRWSRSTLTRFIPELMTAEERRMLNDYHRKVCEALSPLLSKEEREWLSVYTRPV